MRHHVLAAGIQLHVNWLDYLILGGYLAMIVGIGVLSRRSVNSSLDFLLSGRALPAWITGLAFVSANLGPSEVLGNAANGAQYGLYGLHYDWIGAIPAMVFLGLVMMPFYYGSKVRSVPEFLRRRFNPQAHLLNSITFAIAQLLVAGINLYFLALILDAVLGWPIWVSVLVAAAVVFCYIVLGGLRSAVYNEVLQFFIILAALLPVLIVGLLKVGGIDGLVDRVRDTNLGPEAMHTFGNTAVGTPNTLGANWIGIVFGLGFVLSFGYWTTNFAEVQRALSANGSRAARLTPIIRSKGSRNARQCSASIQKTPWLRREPASEPGPPGRHRTPQARPPAGAGTRTCRPRRFRARWRR